MSCSLFRFTVLKSSKIRRFGRPGDPNRLQAGACLAGRSRPSQPYVPDDTKVPALTEDSFRRWNSRGETRADRRSRRAKLPSYVQEKSSGLVGQDRQSNRPILLDARGSVPAQGRFAPRGSSRRGKYPLDSFISYIWLTLSRNARNSRWSRLK